MDIGKRTKTLFITIWTGIFLTAACLIVRGSKLLSFDFGKKVVESISMSFLIQNSAFFEYIHQEDENQSIYTSLLLKKWPFSMAVEQTNSNDEVSLEYAKQNQKIDYSILSANLLNNTNDTNATNEEKEVVEDIATIASTNMDKINQLKKSGDPAYLIKNFYVVDATTVAATSMFPVKKMLETDYSMKKKKKPQILIYHTHGSTESFADSRAGKIEDSIVGVGAYLAKLLEEEYGYLVIHDKTQYDKINGKTDRNKAYNQSLAAVEKTLKENPDIEVVIDLHRDGVNGTSKKLTTVNGKKTARIMLFNGLSRNKKGPIDYLANPNLTDNLAFSLQVKLKAMEYYPNFTTPNYLKGYRYNLHVVKRSLLVELGNQNNTVSEAMNAMEPLADVINQVLE